MTAAPTPGQFAEALAREFAKESDDNPFYDHIEVSKQRLCLLATIEVFGSDHPLAQFLKAYESADRLSFPVNWNACKGMAIEDEIDEMRSAWEVIEQDFTYTSEEMRK